MTFKATSNLRIVYYGQHHGLGFKGIKYVRKGDTVNIPSGCTIDEIEENATFKYMEPDKKISRVWEKGYDLPPIETNSLQSVVGNLEDIDINPGKLQ